MFEEVKLLFYGGINLFFFLPYVCLYVCNHCHSSLYYHMYISYYPCLKTPLNWPNVCIICLVKDPKVIEISIIRLNSSFLMTCLFFLTAHAPWIWPLHASDGRPAVTDGAGALPPTRRGGPPRTTTTRPHPTTPTQW